MLYQCRVLINISLIILALPLAQSAAQVVIRPRDIPRQAGVVAAYWSASDAVNGIEVAVGPAGADRRWNLTAYQFDDIAYDTLIDPQAAPAREQFPSANRVLRSDLNDIGLNLGSGYQYEVVADNGWYMLGVQGSDGLGGNQPLVYPNPLLIMPMPAQFEDAWDIAARYEIGFPAPDTLMGGMLDSIYLRISIGGFSQIDGWGVVVYSGGELPALRQRISTGGRITVVGTYTLLGQRREIELPFGFDIEASQTYRWMAPAMGEIARITSMPGEQEAEFNLASSVRVRRVVPQLTFPLPLLTFGIVHPGNSGMANLVISNAGEGLGSIFRVLFTGGLESEIEIISALPLVIEPDSSARLRFLWSPTSEKSLAGNSAAIFHNDPQADNPRVFHLQGATPEFAYVPNISTLPQRLILAPVYPNPFNGSVTIEFALPAASNVRLTAQDISGRIMWTSEGAYSTGRHSITLDAATWPAGLYRIQLLQQNISLLRNMVLVR